jgi:hypothetical protein
MVTNKSYYEVYGVFCSLNCAKKHVLEQLSHDQQQLLMQLNELCVNVYGMNMETVFNAKEAPPRIFLKMFGGHMDIEEYRVKSVNVRTVMVTPPFVSHAMILAEHAVNKCAADTPVIEPLREGHHELRGLRRPTHAVTDSGAPPPRASKFDAYVLEQGRTRVLKRARTKATSENKGNVGLGMFLKSASSTAQ